jgi:hypothetical protein
MKASSVWLERSAWRRAAPAARGQFAKSGAPSASVASGGAAVFPASTGPAAAGPMENFAISMH